MSQSKPTDVGILAMEMYVPTRFVTQKDMEAADGCDGKYTLGLGQDAMAFVDDREDITSCMLTVVDNLLQKYSISPSQIGRLEVGTETLTDKSKSVKTSLLRLFGDNTDLEGVTNINACYGGTAALFNCVDWVESSSWDGRYALVVCGDIAVYEKGPARPTGGCGTVAMLVGPDAPLVFDTGVRSSHNLDVYDFYKPFHSEYAAVDGKLSQWAYLSSCDTTYTRYKAKWALRNNGEKIDNSHFDYYAFHSPYNKLVQKGFGRFMFSDARDNGADGMPDALVPHLTADLSTTYESRDIEMAIREVANAPFKAKVLPCCKINKNIGNCYTGSVYSSLLSVVCDQGDSMTGKRVLLFPYGSGSVASCFSVRGVQREGKFSLASIQATVNIFDRLDKRSNCTVEEFSAALDLRAACYGKAPMTPAGSTDHIASGTYYLVGINDKHHRQYEKKP
jgi:hydroxymethylglutaryl-CoA synthase